MARSPLFSSAAEREQVSVLIARNSREIDDLRKGLSAALQVNLPEFVDDLFLLRYVLSNVSKPQNMLPQALQAVKWRTDNKDIVAAARSRSCAKLGLTSRELKAADLFQPCRYIGATTCGDPMVFVRPATVNQFALMEILSEEALHKLVSFFNEIAWDFCNTVTRSRGYLVKQYTFVDCTNASLAYDRRFFSVIGKVSKQNEWLRPQLQAKAVVLNPPRWVRAGYAAAELFVSKKAMAKVVLYSPPVNKAEGGSLAKQFVTDQAQWPDFLGGSGFFPELPLEPACAEDLTHNSCEMSEMSTLKYLPALEDLVDRKALPQHVAFAVAKPCAEASSRQRWVWSCFRVAIALCTPRASRSWLM